VKSLPRALAVVATASLAVLTVGAGTASAHVRVSSADATAGGYGEITFRVPNESDTASTVSLAVQLPTDAPLASVNVKPVPGWTAQLQEGPLPEPVTDDDGNQITEAVTSVTWTADAGGGIAPGQYQSFSMVVGPLPDADSITFPAIQTRDDGSESAWIEPTVDGQAEPEYPAPTLSLTATGAATDAHGSSADTADTATTATDTAASTTDADGGTSGVAVSALVVGILALLAALAGLAVALRGRRNPTA
jgi:uncharacterized protein YcnI